jgi:hypothetical protein
MKRVILFGLVFGIFVAAQVQAQPDSLWSRIFGPSGGNTCYSHVQTIDGGYALAGCSFGMGEEACHFSLVRTDEDGDRLWNHWYGEGNYGCQSLVQTADSGFAMAGWGGEAVAPYRVDFCLVRTDKNGNCLWSRYYRGGGSEACTSIIQTIDGGFALAGYASSFEHGGVYFWLVRVDENGDSLWSQTYGGGGEYHCYSLVQTADGGFVLAGYIGVNNSSFWLLRTDENGDSLWSNSYRRSSLNMCYSLIQTNDGGFALAGTSGSRGGDFYDFWLVRTDENGDSLWSRTYGGESADICTSLIQMPDGGFALAGTTGSYWEDTEDFWVVRTDENGDSLWSRTFGGPENDECYSIILNRDGGFTLAGTSGSFHAYSEDFWLIRFGPENAIRDENAITPLSFGLDMVYPNPFNSSSVVSYKLQVASEIKVGLFDLDGRLVKMLEEGWEEAGAHEAVIEGADLASGIYLVKLSDGKRTAVSKACIMR